MTPRLLAVSLLLLLAAGPSTLPAADNYQPPPPAKAPEVWNARITSEDSKGNKIQIVLPFMPLDDASAPVNFGNLDGRMDLNLLRSGENDSDRLLRISFFWPASGAPTEASPNVRPIYRATLPVEFGKDLQLLKTPDGTLTLRLTNTADKE